MREGYPSHVALFDAIDKVMMAAPVPPTQPGMTQSFRAQALCGKVEEVLVKAYHLAVAASQAGQQLVAARSHAQRHYRTNSARTFYCP